MPSFLSYLICPWCKTPLAIKPESMNCSNCGGVFSIKEGIPIFLAEEERENWDKYHVDVYTSLLLNPERKNFTENVQKDPETYLSAPITEDLAYLKYADNWDKMLDVGCGDGVFSAPLSDRVAEIYCVDPSFLALKRLRNRSRGNMFPICSFGERLPFPNDFFDGVFCIFVIEHLTKPVEMLMEIHRVLKPTGHLVISTDSKYFYRYFRPVVEYIKYRRYRKDDPTHVNLMTPKQARKLPEKANFISEVEHLGYWLRGSRYFKRIFPRFLRDPFLTSGIVHRCRPLKGV